MRCVIGRFGPLALSLSLAACQGGAALDIPPPPSDWQPQGINAANIAAMAAHPADLVRGHGDRQRTGWEATAPVLRLWRDRVKPLPISPLEMGAAGGAPGGGAPSGDPAAAPGGASGGGSPPSPPAGGS